MANVILYNPGLRFNEVTRQKQLGIPLPGNKLPNGELEPFKFADAEWENILPNELKSYPQHVAMEMKKRWSFLEVVAPEKVGNYKTRMKKEDAEIARFKDDVPEKELSSEEEKVLKGIPEAKSKEVKTVFKAGKYIRVDDENQDYEGEDDLLMINKRPGMAGVFGAA